jgi:hypothetical protein
MFLKIIKLVSKAAKILGYGKPFPMASFSYWITSLSSSLFLGFLFIFAWMAPLRHACLLLLLCGYHTYMAFKNTTLMEKLASY